MPVSPPGTLAAAEVIVEDQVITLVSLYAGWKTPADGRKLSHADAAAHRLLSDLAAILTTPSGHRIVATGDLNIVNRYGDHGDPYWAARYATVFDRVEAMGLRFVGPAAPNGPQASPKSCPRARRRPDLSHQGRGVDGATRQLDFVFASQPPDERLTVRTLNTSEAQ